MTARRLNIKQRAAALEAAEAQRRFQAETLGEAAQPAEGPNQDRFLQQLTGRVRSAPAWTAVARQLPAWPQQSCHHQQNPCPVETAPWQANTPVNACNEPCPIMQNGRLLHGRQQDSEPEQAQ